MAVPFLGAVYLSVEEYAQWALIATLSTALIVFDFGVPALATKLSAEGRLTSRALAALVGITAVPPLVLGVGAAAAWPKYAELSTSGFADSHRVQLVIVLVALGTALRSGAIVFASIALGRAHFRSRAEILVSGAVLQAIATLCFLIGGVGVAAFAFGLLVGGSAQLAVGVFRERRIDHGGSGDREIAGLVRRFAGSKSLVAMLGLVVTQGDRWILGLVAPPELVSVYDLAVRASTVPKVAVLQLGAGIVGEAARTPSRSDGRRLLARSNRYAGLVYAALLVPISVLVGIGALMFAPLPVVVGVFVATAIAHGLNAQTAPLVLALNGRGMPQFELFYLVPLAVICVLGYAAGIVIGSGVTVIVSTTLALASCSAGFLLLTGTWTRKAWRDI